MLSRCVVRYEMKRDGRKLDHETLEEFRMMAMERLEAGEKASSVMSSYGLCRTTIYKWKNGAKDGNGLEALRSRKAGGRPRKPTAVQERKVLRRIDGKDPRRHGFDFGLWTRKVVGDPMARKFGVRPSPASTGYLLARLGPTPRKPLRRAYERDPEAIAAWKNEVYPKLAALAKRRGAEIYSWDESGFRANAVHGRTWAIKGRTPVIAVPGTRQSVSAASAVNAKGAFWFATYKGGLNADLFVAMLKLLMRRRRTPLFPVLDSLPAHKAKAVRDYVGSTEGKLEFHFLPGHAPDVNPDELAWNYMKRTGTARRTLLKGETSQDCIETDLFAIQRNPAPVRSFLRATSVDYITDGLVIARGLFFGVFAVAAAGEVGGRVLGFCLDLRRCLA